MGFFGGIIMFHKKILFVAPRFHTNQYYLTKLLAESGFKVDFFANESKHSENHTDIKPIIIGYSKLSKLLFRSNDTLLKLGLPSILCLKEIFRIKPDVIIIRECFIHSLVIAIICRLFALKVILYTQKPKYGGKPPLLLRLYRRIFSKNVITPVNGDISKVNMDNICFGQKWNYVPFISKVNPKAWERRYFRDETINILTIAKFTPRKKVLELIMVIHKLIAQFTTIKIRLTIVGTILDNNTLTLITDYIQSNNLDNHIEILLNVPHEKMQDIFLSNDIFVLPSIKEPAAVSHLEAMSHGLAVVCSSDNGTASYIEEGINGFIFDSENFDADLLEKLTLLLSKPDEIEKMGKEGLRMVEEKHNIERYINSLKLIID